MKKYVLGYSCRGDQDESSDIFKVSERYVINNICQNNCRAYIVFVVVTEYFSNLIRMFVKKKGVRLIAFVNFSCLARFCAR